jgi:hypothetical protein
MLSLIICVEVIVLGLLIIKNVHGQTFRAWSGVQSGRHGTVQASSKVIQDIFIKKKEEVQDR